MLTALTALWERLRADVPGLPLIRPIVSSTNRRQDHGPERWSRDEEGYVTGLIVTADVLQEGAEAVVETVLHDAAHLLNWTRDVKDTTMRGVYHNAAFLTAAEEVGFEWPPDTERVKGRGYTAVRLTDAARRRHALDVAALEEVIPDVLPHLELPAPTSVDRVNRISMACKCDPARKFRIGRTVAAQGPIICGVCGKPFEIE
jgi:hypothetical protein